MNRQTVPVSNIERFAIHDGPGIRTTVFFQGCPLKCEWCANPESQKPGRHLMFLAKNCVGCGRCAAKCPQNAISLKEGKAYIDRGLCQCCGTCEETCPNGAVNIVGREMRLSEIYQLVIRDRDYYKQSGGGITLSGGEALLHIQMIEPLLKKCREQGIHIAVETCGDVPIANMEAASRLVDLFLFDIKTLNAVSLKKYTGGNLTQIFNNFLYLAEREPERIIIRVPVIPNLNDTGEELQKIFILAINNGIRRIDLLPYHTLGMAKYRQLNIPYLFACTESMKQETIWPFLEMGERMGLQVTVGG